MAFNQILHDYVFSEINEFKVGTGFKAEHKDLGWLKVDFEIIPYGFKLGVGIKKLSEIEGEKPVVIPVPTHEFKDNFKNIRKIYDGLTSYILDDRLAVVEKPWERAFVLFDGEKEYFMGVSHIKKAYSKVSMLKIGSTDERQKDPDFLNLALSFIAKANNKV